MTESAYYYKDDVGNEWSKKHFTKEEAEAESKAMIYYPSRQASNMKLLNKELNEYY